MKLKTPRFRLRSLLLVIAVFSAFFASVVIPAKRQAQAVRSIETFRPSKGTSPYGPGHMVMLGYRHQRTGQSGEVDESPLRYWMRTWFGNEHFGDVVTVQLDNTEFGDSDLSIIESLHNVDFLRLANTRITDAGLERLSQFESIEFLALNNTEISDDGLRALEAMPNLQQLSISNTSVTDESVPALASLSDLRELWLKDTDITEQGFQRLKRSLPDCKIQSSIEWNHQRAAMSASDVRSITIPNTEKKTR